MDERALIDELVSRWHQLRSRGEETPAEELCRDHPELLETVRQELTNRTTTGAWSRESSRPCPAADPEATCAMTAPAHECTDAELTELGPFRIVKLIAEGGMGAVYEAEDLQLGRKVALKLMRPGAAGHEMAHARFLREARAAAQLAHDHIVPIYQVGQDKGIPYLAMPLLRGQTLDERLRLGRPLLQSEVLRIGREIAEGLAAAHANGMIHRDIKPANVWLEEGSGRAKILDFGLARVATETARLTQDGSILGTPAFMAPEQASGSSDVDHRSDLFSLGSVLYRMSTGKLPFPARTPGAILMALVRDDPVPPRRINPETAPALEALILGLLAKQADQRPQSAQAVVEQIRRLERIEQPGASDGVDLEITMETPPGVLVPVRRASGRLPAVLISLVVVGGLVVVACLPRRNVPATPARTAPEPAPPGRQVPDKHPPTPAGRFTEAGVDRSGARRAGPQVEELRNELKRRNPDFDGKLMPTIRHGAIVALHFNTDHVTDIAPVRALTDLRALGLMGSKPKNGSLADLSPLKGMSLTEMSLSRNKVSDLTPLQGMPLAELDLSLNPVEDLSPLRGMPLLTPLAGMPLVSLSIDGTPVTDPTPLKNLPLKRIVLDFQAPRDAQVLRAIKTLETINNTPAAQFWKDEQAPVKVNAAR